MRKILTMLIIGQERTNFMLKRAVSFITLSIVVLLFYSFAGYGTGSLISKATASETPELLYKELIFEHSVVDETITQHFTFKNSSGKRVSLQEKQDDEWVNVHTEKFEKNNKLRQTMSVDILAPSHSGTVDYRIVSGLYKPTIIHSFSVENHDPADYSDYVKIAYDEVKEYCGNVYITVGNEEKMGERKALGLAATAPRKVEIRQGMDTDTLKWVARHECGHILQHEAYDKHRGEYNFTEKRSIQWLNDDLSQYYDEEYENDGGTGYSEKNADCIAAYLDPDKNNNQFYSLCQGNQGQAAVNIVQGKKATDIIINDNFSDAVKIKNTGYAVTNAVCKKDAGIVVECSQQFQNGIVKWNLDNGDNSLSFIKDGKVYSGRTGFDYFYPSYLDSELLKDFYASSNSKNNDGLTNIEDN